MLTMNVYYFTEHVRRVRPGSGIGPGDAKRLLHRRPFLPWLFVLLVATLAMKAHAQGISPKCSYSSAGSKSSLSWESGLANMRAPLASGEVAGRVLSVDDAKPIANAVISLTPGGRSVESDSAGRFDLLGVTQGRYLLQVVASGSNGVADSVTVGFDGIRIVAVLGFYVPADIACQTYHAPTSGPCFGSVPGLSNVSALIADLVSSTDTTAVRFRAKNYLPRVESVDVTLVTDSTICKRASAALAETRPKVDANYGAWVLRIGPTRYVAFNGKLVGPEHSLLLVVLDTSFRRLSTLQP